MDETNLLDRFLDVLREPGVRYCVVGGQAVNAYVDPVVSLDLDVVVAVEQLASLESRLLREFRTERFAHRLDVAAEGSDLRVQIQTDPRYAGFVARAEELVILGRPLMTAAIDDVLRGKVWAVQDATRRASKRQKDLADIARLLEAFPELRPQVPPDVLARLVS